MKRWILLAALALIPLPVRGDITALPTQPAVLTFTASQPSITGITIRRPDGSLVPLVPGPQLQLQLIPNPVTESHEGWIPRQINGITFYIVPIK
jgi:hypothetical protein